MESSYGLIEIILVFGIALALMCYEWHSVRRSMRDDISTRGKKPMHRDGSETDS